MKTFFASVALAAQVASQLIELDLHIMEKQVTPISLMA